MKKAGVPILPGSDGPVDSEEKALKIAKDIGLPGHHQGDGRRRRPRHARRPRRRRSCRKALKTAQREAEAAFGVGDVYIEKYVESRATSSSRSSATITAPSSTSASASARSSGATRSCSRKSPSLGAHREDAAQAGRHRRRRGEGGAVHQRRHVRVPDGRQGQLLLPGGEHPPPGRAPGHRDGHRHRHRQGADPHRGRASGSSFKQGDVDVHRPLDRVPDQRRGSGDVRAVAGRDPRVQRAGRPRRARRHASRTPSARSRRTTTR